MVVPVDVVDVAVDIVDAVAEGKRSGVGAGVDDLIAHTHNSVSVCHSPRGRGPHEAYVVVVVYESAGRGPVAVVVVCPIVAPVLLPVALAPS